jgi:hypothetical protein
MVKAPTRLRGQSTVDVMVVSAEVPVCKVVNEDLDHQWRFQVQR